MRVLRSPVYFILSLLACGYLVAANLQGWSPLQPFNSAYARFHGYATQHK